MVSRRPRRGRTSDEGEGITLARVAVAVIALYPPTVPRHWHAPAAWLREAVCIHAHEGAWDANTGNGYEGGFQFLPGTWHSVAGHGHAYDATPREQLYRAWLVWKRDGGSWREWGTARACGLK